MTRAVALLRGINVGGKNKLAMRDLIALFGDAGCGEVSTFIQSGNVLFSAEREALAGLPSLIEAQIAARFGLKVPVVVRTARELAATARAHPLGGEGADAATLLVMFLATRPSAAAVAALDPARSPPDQFVVRGREIFLRCPNGLARTKLTNAWFDSKLATMSTGRNWRTVLQLVELTSR